MRKIICKAAVFFIFLFVLIPAVHAQENIKGGIIRGKVLNGTEDAKQIGSLEIKLHIFDSKGKQETVVTKSNSKGEFLFKNVSPDLSSQYVVSSIYKGVVYLGRGFIFGKGEEEKNVELRVYETTTEDNNIRIDREHIILSLKDSKFTVTNVFIIKNSGSRALVSDKTGGKEKEETLIFSLPAGAKNLRSSSTGARFADKFIYSEPIRPGTEQASFVYEMDFVPDFSFKKVAEYSTDNIDILLSGANLRLEGNGFREEEKKNIRGKEFIHYVSKKPVQQGEIFSFHINFMPKAADFSQWLVTGLVGVVILLGFSYPFLKRKRKDDIDVEGEGCAEKESTEKEREELLLAIASLDDEFGKGAISEEEYKTERKKKKERLKEITQDMRISH